MLTCVHNQAMGEVFMIGAEKNIKSFCLVSIENVPGWETGLFSPQEKELGLT